MVIVICILSIYVFFKTVGYAIYEYKDNSNKFARYYLYVFCNYFAYCSNCCNHLEVNTIILDVFKIIVL